MAAVPMVRAEDAAFRDAGIRVVAVAVLALLAAIVNGWSPLVPAAVAAVGGLYAAELAIDDASLDVAAPAVAVGLLLAAELAYWSLDERVRVPGDAGEGLRHAALVALFALVAFFAATVLLALVDGVRANGLALDLLGAAAAAGSLLAVLLLARRRGEPG